MRVLKFQGFITISYCVTIYSCVFYLLLHISRKLASRVTISATTNVTTSPQEFLYP